MYLVLDFNNLHLKISYKSSEIVQKGHKIALHYK
jgi:hypothetical protein